MKKYIVANHKMQLSYDEAKMLKEQMDDIDFDNINFIVCPSFININIFKQDYVVGAQNCFYENTGPYNGEISPYHLKLIGCQYVILGHPSIREKETDKEIKDKVKAALNVALIPILCIGETKIQKDLNRSAEVIKKQLFTAIKDLSDEEISELIISYEPVWAVDGKIPMNIKEIETTIEYIKKVISEITTSTNYKILYGGSVYKETINSILNIKDIDGVLIGGASIKIEELKGLIEAVN